MVDGLGQNVPDGDRPLPRQTEGKRLVATEDSLLACGFSKGQVT
jgi:hypothetical protein